MLAYNGPMSEGPAKASRFQFSLKTLLTLIAVIGAGMASIRAGQTDVAMGAVFPFAIGFVTGELVPFPYSAWLSAILSPFIECIVLVAIGTIANGGGVTSTLQAIAAGSWFGAILLLSGYPSLAAFAGSIVARRFKEARSLGNVDIPENRERDDPLS